METRWFSARLAEVPIELAASRDTLKYVVLSFNLRLAASWIETRQVIILVSEAISLVSSPLLWKSTLFLWRSMTT